MRFSFVSHLLLIVLVLMPFQINAQDRKQPVKLPMDTDEPVLEFDLDGGFRIAPPAGFKRSPKLRIYSDGRVVCGRTDPHLGQTESRMTDDHLMELMEFVVNKQDIFSISREVIDRKVKESGKQILIADAPTSSFKINVNRGEHQVAVYAVSFIDKQFAEIDEIQRISAIQERLLKEVYRAQLGTADNRKIVLQDVTAALRQEAPDAPAWTLDEIQSASTAADGTLRVTFQRYQRNDEGKVIRSTTAKYLKKSPQVKAEIRINRVDYEKRNR